MNKPQLWIVRHAAPQVAPGTCYGALDLQADPQATQAAARALAQALPKGVRIWHSPLSRCEHLALDLLGLRPDLCVEPDPRLRELDFGRWEGQTWEAIGQPAIDAWVADFARHRPGGGEALADMLARVGEALDAARAWAGPRRQDVVWISHAGVARCVAWLNGPEGSRLPQSTEWPTPAPAWGGWETQPL